ncbi:Filament-like plant protein 3 [Platanthera zijinensis]|uniref:Filament-like plant protein 3 n=1 Tax=Platanthera zijinensis TaxID=2320716 RepID=A0AAP0BW28_9ASPA
MDRRSGLWRRKSREKSSAESESSDSVSSYSERLSDEQGVFRSSPTESSPNHVHSPKISSINEGKDGHETVKSLTEKLSAALLDVAAKEHLVKQHAKVTEEAISGWESAEAEVAALKQLLETSSLKNSVLEEKVNHLDEALRECVRQLRKSREEQEQKVQDADTKARESESSRFELEIEIKELHLQLEAVKKLSFITTDKSLYSRLESLEKENKCLKTELLAQSEQLRVCMLERDLSTQAAESASKQHLESIKKVAKLESECRRLRSIEFRKSTGFQSTVILSGVFPEQEILNSWASAGVSECDQFKQEKTCSRDITGLTEIDLMDDFLEMERLAATPEVESDRDFVQEKSQKNEIEDLQLQVAELEKKIQEVEYEKGQLKLILAETSNQLEISCNQLALAGDEVVELQRHIELANESKEAAMAEAFGLEGKRKETELQLEMARSEILRLSKEVEGLQGKLNDKTLSTELEEKIEMLETRRKDLQSQLNSAVMQTEELREQVSILEEKLEEESTICAAYLGKAEENEVKKEELEIQLISVKSRLEEERSVSAKLADRAKIAEAAKISSESQLELARSEAGRLNTEVRHLQAKIEEEATLSAEYSAKCRVLEDELSRRKKCAELLDATKGAVKFNKEKELAEAAGKLAECQKTIASLGRQLKSLTNIDEFVFEADNPRSDGFLPYFSFPDSKTLHSNGSSGDSDWTQPPLSSSASVLPGFGRLLSRSRSSDHVETPRL